MLNNIIIFDFPLRVVFQTIFCSFVYDDFVHIQLRSILVYVKFTNFLHMCSTMFALGLIKIWGNFIAPILLSSKINSSVCPILKLKPKLSQRIHVQFQFWELKVCGQFTLENIKVKKSSAITF